MDGRFRIEWSSDRGELVAFEPTLDEVQAHVRELAAAYNDAHNAPLLGHEVEISQTDVIDHYTALRDRGARAFLLYCNGSLAGDADLRGIHQRHGEFAFMIAAPGAQGKGLGTAFATMIHAFGFAKLPIDRIYASIIPANTASRRAFDKLGYRIDESAEAQALADPGDLVMSIDRPTFEQRHAAQHAELLLEGPVQLFVEERVRSVARQSGACVDNCLVDRPEALLDGRHGRRVEVTTALVENHAQPDDLLVVHDFGRRRLVADQDRGAAA